jgi:phosphoenolpyruvate carboxykinase (GTP)
VPPGIRSAVPNAAGAIVPPHSPLTAWVHEIAELTRSEAMHWCDGSTAEDDRLAHLLADAGLFIRLDAAEQPNSCPLRSDAGKPSERSRSAKGRC